MYKIHYISTEIYATPERQDILREHGVRYWLDMESNFKFPNEEIKERAIRIMEDEMVL